MNNCVDSHEKVAKKRMVPGRFTRALLLSLSHCPPAAAAEPAHAASSEIHAAVYFCYICKKDLTRSKV